MQQGSVKRLRANKRDGSITWRIWVAGKDPATGRRRVVTETVRGIEADAERRRRELLDALDQGDTVGRSPLTLAVFLDRWLATIRETLRPSTAQSYRTYVTAYLSPLLGQRRLSELTSDVIQDAYNRLLRAGGRSVKKKRRPLSRRTVFHAHRVLSQALKHAVRTGQLPRNPCDRVTPPKPEAVEIRTIEPAESEAVFAHLREHAPWAVAPTALALYTGLRRSEVLGLQWGDLQVGDVNPVLWIRRAYVRLDKTDGERDAIRPPKSRKGLRAVAVSAGALEILGLHRQDCERTAVLLERSLRPGDWVFGDPLTGLPYRPSSLSQAFRRACRAVGVDGAHFHSLRHTHATALLRANVHPKVVQERLGHSTISTTIDTYSHTVPGLQAAAAEAFDRAFRPAGKALPRTA